METILGAKKQNIITVAADLFQEKGFKAATMRDIAERVGIEASSIYSHVKSKDEILKEICMSCSLLFINGMEEIDQQDISARKKIKSLIALHIRVAHDYPATVNVFNDDWKFLAEPYLSTFIDGRKMYASKFKKILTEGKKEGKFDFENVDITFTFIINTLSWTYEAFKKLKKEEIETQLTTLIIKSINS
jgi:TetR/AcrR family transcriptional regulator, cholesterol catabolism regulator